MLRKSILIGLFVLNNNRRTKITLGRVGEAIVLTCFLTAGYGRQRKLGVGFRTAGYGRHRSQWVNNIHTQGNLRMSLSLPRLVLKLVQFLCSWQQQTLTNSTDNKSLLSNLLICCFLDNVWIWGSFCPICHLRLRKDFCIITVYNTTALIKDKALRKPSNQQIGQLCQVTLKIFKTTSCNSRIWATLIGKQRNPIQWASQGSAKSFSMRCVNTVYIHSKKPWTAEKFSGRGILQNVICTDCLQFRSFPQVCLLLAFVC